jgi:hypothetical protein
MVQLRFCPVALEICCDIEENLCLFSTCSTFVLPKNILGRVAVRQVPQGIPHTCFSRGSSCYLLAKRSMRCSVRLGERCNSTSKSTHCVPVLIKCLQRPCSVRHTFVRFVHGGSKSLRVFLWCSHQDLKSTGEGFVLIAQQCAAIFLSETIRK